MLPSTNVVDHSMDMGDDAYTTSVTNGFNNQGTVSSSSSSSSLTTNLVPNGHSLLGDDSNNPLADTTTSSNECLTKSAEVLNGMECDSSISDSNNTMDVEVDSSDVHKIDDQRLLKILQFGRELHSLKQQLNLEYGESPQHDKMLQVIIIIRYGTWKRQANDFEYTGPEKISRI